jgi:hypothetical protein
MNTMQKTLAGLSLALIGASASAATVSFSNILGTWFDAAPPGNISSNTGAGTGNTQVRWGGASEASGYNFTAVGSPSAVVPPSPSATFALGTFSHVNFGIPAGTSITGIKLRVTADISVDGTPVSGGSRSFVFQFLHDETPNGADPCAFGGAFGVGVNAAGCADRVRVQFTDASESFDIGGLVYTVNVFGFESGGSTVTDFLTAENATNTARLIANVTLRDSLTVSAPGTASLAVLSLLGMAALRRRAG